MSTTYGYTMGCFPLAYSWQQTILLSLYLHKQGSYQVLLEDEKKLKKAQLDYILSSTDPCIFPGVLACYLVFGLLSMHISNNHKEY